MKIRQIFDQCVTMAISLLLLSLPIAANADSGGRFAIPELDGSITIEDEDGAAPSNLCTTFMDWPSGAGEVLSVTISNISGTVDGTGQMVIVHPDDPLADQEMYVFFSINDNSPNVSVNIDRLALMFDLSHDHVVADTSSYTNSDDRGIRFNRNGTVERVFGDVTNPTVDSDPTPFPDARACVSERDDDNDGNADSTGWVMEAQLIPADLGLNNFNSLMGISALVINQDTIPGLGAWPGTVTADPLSWANLITRAPIDFVLLIDQSGSMSTDDKWDSAKQAGNNFRSVLSQLHDTDLSSEYSALGVAGGGDRLGLATFSSSLSGNADVNSALTSVDATASDYTGVLPDSPGGGTPMADGVNQTITMFGGASNLGDSALADPNLVRQKIVMMLSDGRHNTPSSTMDFDNAGGAFDFDYLPVTPNCDTAGAVDSLVRVNTVAVGTNGSTDPAKLSGISDCFSGSQLTNIYTSIGATGPALTAELSRFYFETIYPYYHLNMITDTGSNFSLQAGERKLLLFAFWADTASVTSLSITQPDTSVANGTCPAGLGYCYLLIDNPEPGEYSNYSAPGAVANGQYALLDLHVEARFSMDNQPHGTSSTITLKARLREGGKAITGADVRVNVRRPEEGFGTFASTHSINGCADLRPTLPGVDIIGGSADNIRLSAAATAGQRIVFASPNLNLQPVVQNGDTNPPAFALMDRLLEACGKRDLDTAQDSGLQLLDDGTNGDETADDGIYTLVYENTEIEGSYIFRFSAQGSSSVGVPFTRLKEIGEYVRVDVDPGNSPISSRDIQQNGTLIIREYSVIPRDEHGGYLGPGRIEDVQFTINGAQPVGGVRDYNNGIYAQIVGFDSTQGEPEVTPVVQGQPVKPDAGSTSAGCPLPLWVLWLIGVLVLVILFLLWLLFLCKFKKRHYL